MVRFGVPDKVVLALRDSIGASVFVETGTYQGETARWAAQHFEQVFTIEGSQSLYDQYGSPLSQLANVTALCGDSREHLPAIVEQLAGKKAVFWLDSHWFGGETCGSEDQCPLLGELFCLQTRKQDALLIDDARLFLAAPPMPHDPAQWPDFGDIVRALPDAGRGLCIQVADDVIFIAPDEASVKAVLVAYTKRRNNLFWQEYARTHHPAAV